MGHPRLHLVRAIRQAHNERWYHALTEDGYDIRTVQELLGHKDVQTTMLYTHVLNRGGRGVHSRLDRVRKAAFNGRGGIIRADRSA